MRIKMQTYQSRNFVRLLGIGVLSLLLTGCGGGTSGTGGSELSGQTLDANDRALPGVRIGVSDDTGTPIAETSSDAEGNFAVSNIYSTSATIEAQYGNAKPTKAVVSFPDGGDAVSVTFKRRSDGSFNSSVRSLSRATQKVAVSGSLDVRSSYPAPLVSASLASGAGPQYSAKLSTVYSASSFSAPVRVVDSFGGEHVLYVAFYHTAPAEFYVAIYVREAEVVRGKSKSDIVLLAKKEFKIAFGKDGKRSDNSSARVPDATVVIPWANGASKSTIKFNFASMTLSARDSSVSSVKYN